MTGSSRSTWIRRSGPAPPAPRSSSFPAGLELRDAGLRGGGGPSPRPPRMEMAAAAPARPGSRGACRLARSRPGGRGTPLHPAGRGAVRGRGPGAARPRHLAPPRRERRGVAGVRPQGGGGARLDGALPRRRPVAESTARGATHDSPGRIGDRARGGSGPIPRSASRWGLAGAWRPRLDPATARPRRGEQGSRNLENSRGRGLL